VLNTCGQDKKKYSNIYMNYDLNDIELYIFNWKKVNLNSIKLYKQAKKYIDNVLIINSDENFNIKDCKNIQLNNNYYYGGQFQEAIRNIKDNKILGIIVGDTINIDFEILFKNLLNTFNNFNTGIYSINDLRSNHKKIIYKINNNLSIVRNTDCGIWFINPEIVKILKNIPYKNLSNLGWGIDIIFIKECKKKKLCIFRDYSLTCDQIDHKTGYDRKNASNEKKNLLNYYKNNYD
jgi:hypothetical protein